MRGEFKLGQQGIRRDHGATEGLAGLGGEGSVDHGALQRGGAAAMFEPRELGQGRDTVPGLGFLTTDLGGRVPRKLCINEEFL